MTVPEHLYYLFASGKMKNTKNKMCSVNYLLLKGQGMVWIEYWTVWYFFHVRVTLAQDLHLERKQKDSTRSESLNL